jgi:hypothetical protein
MHTVDRDSEQGKRVLEVTDELLDVVDEFSERDYPPDDLVSALTAALALKLAILAGPDDMSILNFADQVRSVILDIHTEYTMSEIMGEPAND